MRVPDPAEGFVVRLDELLPRLGVLAETPPPAALTDPDQPSGERWECGQVWAHMVEFVPYWMDQIRDAVTAGEPNEPVPFGRVKSDPNRIAGIEAGRHDSIGVLHQRLSEEINDLKAFLADLSEDDWRVTGRHQTLGVMPMERIVEEFLVGHLKEHAAQLESLASQ